MALSDRTNWQKLVLVVVLIVLFKSEVLFSQTHGQHFSNFNTNLQHQSGLPDVIRIGMPNFSSNCFDSQFTMRKCSPIDISFGLQMAFQIISMKLYYTPHSMLCYNEFEISNLFQILFGI